MATVEPIAPEPPPRKWRRAHLFRQPLRRSSGSGRFVLDRMTPGLNYAGVVVRKEPDNERDEHGWMVHAVMTERFPTLGKTAPDFFQSLEKTAAPVSNAWKTLVPVAPPAALAAVPGLHIWYADLTALAGEAHYFVSLLDAAEREEIQRLRHEHDRHKMILRRGVRRVVLGRHLDCAPERLHFERASQGKPSVPGLAFSASSSQSAVLLAVTHGAEVGADIEDVSAFQFAPALAGTCCSHAEREHLASLPADVQAAAFLRLWTAKEAVLKLRGTGFREQVNLHHLLENLCVGERVADLPLTSPLVASLAIRGA